MSVLNNVIRFAFIKSTFNCIRFLKFKRNIVVEGFGLCKQYGDGSHVKSEISKWWFVDGGFAP